MPRSLAHAGTSLLVVALVATAVLAADAVLLLTPPGCGEGSGCARAARSAWARIPGVEWPVAALAFSYFVAVGIAWMTSRPARGFRWIVRLGAAASALYLVLMIAGHIFCPWCLAAHVANFGFLVVTEIASRRPGSGTPLARMAVTFVTVSAALLAVQALVGREKIQVSLPAEHPLTVTYAGRHADGPETAPIRIVVYSDYQCPDCRRIESAIRSVTESRGDVVVSSKHFPMCADCNPHMRGQTLHANACWAARAAEAAAILHGAPGRRRMHRWLFDRGGSFTDAEIQRTISEFGWDIRQFLAVMQSERTLEVVQRDVDEARSLGVFFTPLVFVNGAELKWRSGRALEALVDAIADTEPVARRFDADPLPLAAGKMITDWSEEAFHALDAAEGAPSLGPADAPVQVVVWGDLQEPNTARLHARLLERITDRGDVHYRFLHYPINQSCNPAASSTRYDQACLAARAAEAARQQAGPDGFWRMLGWLLEHQGGVSEETIGAAATQLGFDRTELLGALRSQESAHVIAQQALAARDLDVRFVPMLWIDGRRAERWQTTDGEHDVLTILLDAAASGDREGAARNEREGSRRRP